MEYFLSLLNFASCDTKPSIKHLLSDNAGITTSENFTDEGSPTRNYNNTLTGEDHCRPQRKVQQLQIFRD